jgi:hypothetical protein
MHALIISCSNYSAGPFDLSGEPLYDDQTENEDYCKIMEY